MAPFEVLEAWHLTVAEHLALVRDVLVPVARLHASTELACSGQPCCALPVLDMKRAYSCSEALHVVLLQSVSSRGGSSDPAQGLPIYRSSPGRSLYGHMHKSTSNISCPMRCEGVTEAERKRSESLEQATALPPPPGADAGAAADSSTAAQPLSRGLPPLPSISTVRVPSDPAVLLRRLPSAEAGPAFRRTEARPLATCDVLLLRWHDPLASRIFTCSV